MRVSDVNHKLDRRITCSRGPQLGCFLWVETSGRLRRAVHPIENEGDNAGKGPQRINLLRWAIVGAKEQLRAAEGRFLANLYGLPSSKAKGLSPCLTDC